MTISSYCQSWPDYIGPKKDIPKLVQLIQCLHLFFIEDSMVQTYVLVSMRDLCKMVLLDSIILHSQSCGVWGIEEQNVILKT